MCGCAPGVEAQPYTVSVGLYILQKNPIRV